MMPITLTKQQKILITMSGLSSLVILLAFVNHFSIDFLLSDRVMVWKLITEESSWWAGFTAQHGPHRLGLMFILSKLGYLLGGRYNSIPDLYINAVLIWSMVPMGLWLKWKITEVFSIYDVIIPFAIATPFQWGTLLVLPYIHVMLPFFALLFAIVLHSRWKDHIVLSLVLVFIACFSVYAIMPALAFTAIQIWRWVKEKKWVLAMILGGAVSLTLMYYFLDYRVKSLGEAATTDWLLFVKALPIIIGQYFFLFNWVSAGLIAVAMVMFIIKLKNIDEFKFRPGLLLLIYAFGGFLFLQALARSGDGAAVFSATRYFTEWGLLVWILAIAIAIHPLPHFSGLIFSILLVWMTVRIGSGRMEGMKSYLARASAFKECVLEKKTFDACHEQNLSIFKNKHKKEAVALWILMDERKKAKSQL